MDIEKLRQTIKSNLVSYGLQTNQIEEIIDHLVADIVALVMKDD